MKLPYVIVALTTLLLFCQVANAQQQSIPPDDVEALLLLQRMLQAERTLNIAGDEVTTLYRPEQTFSATQTIERQGDHGFKLVYHSPSEVDGETYVDNGKVFWHSIPSAHRLEVGPSRLSAFRQRSNAIFRSLNDHQLIVHLVGHDIVAGQIAQVVQVTAASPQIIRKFWIDPVTGAQLKIQTFGSLGQLVSETYYTRFSYATSFSRNEFGPPPVDSSYTVVPMAPHGSTIINSIPTTDQCGFILTLPTYLPSGFSFQSSFIMPIKGQKLVGLNYANGLITLSIFEQPYRQRPGSAPDQDEFTSPRQNVLTARKNGYRYILVGPLPQDILQQIAESMK